MGKIKGRVMFLFALIVIGACTKEEVYLEENLKEKELITVKTDLLPLPEIVDDEIVIRYDKKDIKEKEKSVIKTALMSKYNFGIIDVIGCSCGETNIEKWVINPYGISIEDLITALERPDNGGGVEGNHEFVFSLNHTNVTSNIESDFSNKVLQGNSEETVKIAVLDTGIDYSYFEGQFLYDTSDSDNCTNEISGWDFVNGDNMPFDDNLHGSIVTKIITNTLDYNTIPYQILPVKVFDNIGRGSYFDIICGLSYVASFEDSFIVNASFGFYGIEIYSKILEDIIEENSDSLLIINSAGNNKNNNDDYARHYPSSYEAENIIGVGGFEYVSQFSPSYPTSNSVLGYDLAPDSNYGYESVDVVAKFNHNIIFSDNTKAIVGGTSFAAPDVTARAARLYFDGGKSQSLIDLKYEVFATCFKSNSLSQKIGGSRILFSNIIYDRSFMVNGLTYN